MANRNKARRAVGANTRGMTNTVGPMSSKSLQSIVEAATPCVFWEPGSPERQGVLSRDPRRGVIIRMALPWPGTEATHTVAQIPVLHGKMAQGHAFTMHNAQVTSWRGQSEIVAPLSYFGDWLASARPTFENLKVWIDELPAFFASPTFRLGNPPGAEVAAPKATKVGKMWVKPTRSIETGPHVRTGRNYAFHLAFTVPRSLDWWLNEWVSPLTSLVSFSVGKPATVTMLSASIKMTMSDGSEHSSPVYIVGHDWPTLDMDALLPRPRERSEPPLLLRWNESHFDLAKQMPRVRRVRSSLDVTFNNYIETIYSDLSEGHEFQNLIQATESLHSRTHGRYKANGGNNAKLIERVNNSTFNQRDRKKITSALSVVGPREFSLAERLQALSLELDLAQPTAPPPWIGPNDKPVGPSWADWVARARNDLSHGNAAIPPHWIRAQNRYLRAVIERRLLGRAWYPEPTV